MFVPRTLYACLAVLRCIFAFSPGYIHPDEWFQHGEPLAGDLFGLATHRTWEFTADAPLRSMASVRLVGAPLALLAWAHPGASGTALFVVQRLTALALSFVVDACITRLVPRQARYAALLAYASSTGALALAVRPFSNGAESALLAGSLLALCTHARAPSARGAAALGALLALGAFARFTFALFALPLGLFFLASAPARHVFAAGAAGGAAALAHVYVDTAYYARGHVVVAPLNALLYNMRGENLAQHGLHPRWLHAVVNAPLVLGVGVYAAALLGALRLRGGAAPGDLPSRASAAVLLCALATLSAAPHQEPRFLLPLSAPAAVLAAHSRLLSDRPHWRRALMGATLTQGVLAALFFNYLHQAGSVPALLRLNAELAHGARVEVHVWRSFMPPAHLLLAGTGDARIALHDHGSAPASAVAAALAPGALLLAPAWARATLPPCANASVWAVHGPHLDMDHLPEMSALVRERGLWAAVAYVVDRSG